MRFREDYTDWKYPEKRSFQILNKNLNVYCFDETPPPAIPFHNKHINLQLH